MSTIEYRSELILWILHDMVPTIVLVFIWSQLYRESANPAFNLPQILTYYLMVVLVGMLTGSHFDQFRAQQIREGKIDYFLTKPLGYFWEILISDLASKALYLLLGIPLLALLWAVIGLYFPLQTPLLSGGQLVMFGGLMVAAYVIEFALSLLVVLLSFWFEGAEGLIHFKWIGVSILSGWMIPLYLMPDWLKMIVTKLPFQYMYAIPIGLLQGTAGFDLAAGLSLAAWLAGLFCVCYLLWKRAIYQYASSGG